MSPPPAPPSAAPTGDDLAARIHQIPGCRKGLGFVIAEMGMVTSEQFGTLPNKRFDEIVRCLQQKHPKFGPGHYHSLDELRKQCRAEVKAQNKIKNRRVAGPPGLVPPGLAPPGLAPPAIAHQGITTIPDARAALAAGAEEPSAEALQDATSEAEDMAVILFAAAEALLCSLYPLFATAQDARFLHPLIEILQHARDMVTSPSHGTAEAVEAVACAIYLAAHFPKGSRWWEALLKVERKCRDVLVWRTQLLLGPGNLRRRDSFLIILEAAAVAAHDAASAAVESLKSNPNNLTLCGRVAALPELQRASAGGVLAQKYISQALHAHRAEVAARFPGTFLSNCQRTAARRGRTRKCMPKKVMPTILEAEAEAGCGGTDLDAQHPGAWQESHMSKLDEYYFHEFDDADNADVDDLSQLSTGCDQDWTDWDQDRAAWYQHRTDWDTHRTGSEQRTIGWDQPNSGWDQYNTSWDQNSTWWGQYSTGWDQ